MIVFPMAGNSSRFKNEGYNQPKYKLRIGTSTVFEKVITGFRHYINQESFCFAGVTGSFDASFVNDTCGKLGFRPSQYAIVELTSPTAGQADTVYQSLSALDHHQSEPITAFNIDTFYKEFRHELVFTEDHVPYLDVVIEEGDHWSFVDPLSNNETVGYAKRVVEKERISELCSTGLYYFPSIQLFKETFIRCQVGRFSKLAEMYIAPMYQELIESGHRVGYRLIPRDGVEFCGVPEEYSAYLTKHREKGDTPN